LDRAIAPSSTSNLVLATTGSFTALREKAHSHRSWSPAPCPRRTRRQVRRVPRSEIPAELDHAVSESRKPDPDLYVRDVGTGPPILLLHGIGADHTIWAAMIPFLSPSFRVIAPDLRGHGRSSTPAGSTYTLEELSTDLLALLSARQVDSAHVVGLSGGALLALRLGLDHPRRLRSLTMVSGAVYTDNHTRSVAERWEETFAREGPEALALRLLKDLYYPDWIEAHLEIADRLRAEIPKKDWTAAVGWGRAVAAFDERKRVGSLVPPALIVQAMDDQVVDASHGRILRQSIPGAKIRIFAETGHLIAVERPKELAEAVAAFVSEVEARRSPGTAPALSR
jgi:pimeloyl-ACP methyl ester carboxylesterase